MSVIGVHRVSANRLRSWTWLGRACQDQNCTIHDEVNKHFPVFTGCFPVKLASSNGRHLKSFLYPPHVTALLAHCWHVGFVSSHLRRFALQVTQPRCAYQHDTFLGKTRSQARHAHNMHVCGKHTVAAFGLFPFGDATALGRFWFFFCC